MTGRKISELFPTVRAIPGDVVLSVRNLTTRRGTVRDVSFEARGGEILGLAGLVGSGKSEVLRAAFGLVPIASGRVTLSGADVTGRSPAAMLEAGFFYLPPDRRGEGLVMMRPVRENVVMAALGVPPVAAALGINRRAEKRLAQGLSDRLELRPNRIERPVETFSGGNQQKVLLARCLTRDVSVYVFDEPTVGVDVGTRAAIYRFIADLAEAGAAVVLISSDLPEIIHLAQRALVFYRGRIAAEFAGAGITEEALLPHFFDREAA